MRKESLATKPHEGSAYMHALGMHEYNAKQKLI